MYNDRNYVEFEESDTKEITEDKEKIENFNKNRKNKKSNNFSALTLAICVTASSIFGFTGGIVSNKLNNVTAENSTAKTESNNLAQNVSIVKTATSSATEKTIPEIVAAGKPAVVEITTEVVQMSRIGQLVSEGAGSGVIISEDGYIVTNNHVIENARNITVRLSDGTEYMAELIGTDPQTDLAVLKIEANKLTAVTFGDSSKLVVGQTTIAVGNPLGELGGTVTSGILSALDREITFEDQTMRLLQTDAAINPGNSGGALFNLKGELIGIVNAKYSDAGIEGLGFAIPINTAKTVIDDIINNGYVKGRIDTGLSVVDISSNQLARMYRVNYTGLYISESVDPQFQSGDRIVYIDGAEIGGLADYKTALNNYSVGDKIEISVVRGSEIITIPLTLAEMGA